MRVFEKRPERIEAMQLVWTNKEMTETNESEIMEWLGDNAFIPPKAIWPREGNEAHTYRFIVRTPFGPEWMVVKSWVVRGPNSTFSVLTDYEFSSVWQEVSE